MIALRRRRHVRLHLAGDAPSVEGIFVGFWAGHYVLHTPAVLEAVDKTRSLEGNLRVPRDRVLFVQELAR